MSAKRGLAMLAIAVSAFAVVPARSASAAPPVDACTLVSQAQVSEILGVKVSAGSHVTPTFVKTCTWTPAAGATKGVTAVTVSLQAADSFAGAKSMMVEAKAGMEAKGDPAAKKFSNESAGGIGDDAFYTTMGPYTSLLVKKGNASFKVAIYGNMPADEAKAKEKALALDVVSKL